jgi:hypothetical protein
MPASRTRSQTPQAPALAAGTLNRAEWVKFLGLFFNKETEASQYFATVERQYNRLKVGTQFDMVDWHCIPTHESVSRCTLSTPLMMFCHTSWGMHVHSALTCLVECWAACNCWCPGVQTTAAANANKPTVAWISHFVFAPDEYYQISFAPYKVQYTQVRKQQFPSSSSTASHEAIGTTIFCCACIEWLFGLNHPTADDSDSGNWSS